MAIFSAILDKLRGHGRSSQPQQQQQPSAQQQQYQPTNSPTQQPGDAIQPLSNVDVDKVLKEMAAKKGGGGNYRESIVDLLKLLDLDSSLEARKELAKELNVNAGAPGTAEQNIALHKAVMRKVAENGGKVPDSMKD
jgi:hypothetical protein